METFQGAQVRKKNLMHFRVLEKEGIHCNMTLLFCLAQVDNIIFF